MRKALISATFFLLLASSFYLLSSPVFAQSATASAEPVLPPLPVSGINLTLSPSVLPITTEPGRPFTSTLKIHNNNTSAEALEIQILKFGPDTSGTKAVFADLGPGDIFIDWLQFSEKQFLIPPGATKEIQVTFTPPSYAAPSLYFAIAFKRQQDPQVATGAATQGLPVILTLTQVTSSRVSHSIELTSVDGKTAGLKTSQKIYEYVPAQFEVAIKNEGNVHELVFGTIFIDWLTGRQSNVGTAEINVGRSYILPQTKRVFTAEWNEGLPRRQVIKDTSGNPVLNDQGKPKTKLEWDFGNLDRFRIGQYKAHIVLAYNDGQRDIPLEADTTFWILPWRILSGVAIVMVMLLLGIRGTILGLLHQAKKISR